MRESLIYCQSAGLLLFVTSGVVPEKIQHYIFTNNIKQAPSRSYSCPVNGCSRSFGRSSTLNRHILTKAKSDLQHDAFAIPLRATKCGVCNKTFEDAPRLRRHLGARACLPARNIVFGHNNTLPRSTILSGSVQDAGQGIAQSDTQLQLWRTCQPILEGPSFEEERLIRFCEPLVFGI
jgi:Zinc finger, C2H2 type